MRIKDIVAQYESLLPPSAAERLKGMWDDAKERFRPLFTAGCDSPCVVLRSGERFWFSAAANDFRLASAISSASYAVSLAPMERQVEALRRLDEIEALMQAEFKRKAELRAKENEKLDALLGRTK